MNQMTVCANPNRLKGEISFEEREKQLANHMDGYNALIASYSVFAAALGLSNSTVTRGIKYLRENGNAGAFSKGYVTKRLKHL